MDGSVGSDFGQRLRALREAGSLTQEELAERAGLSAKAIGALERGERRRPYPHTIRALADGLGLTPEELPRLTSALRTHPEPSAPPSPGTSARPLVGREADLAALGPLLTAGRLVTLTGPGGVGKTRLARELMDRAGPAFPGGVVFCELAAVRDPAGVLPLIGSTLGVPESAGDPAGLAPFLQGRRLLVVLDNVEQVVGCGPLVAELLEASPELTVLATSRAALRVRAEHEAPVGPLDPTAAATLFRERARAAGSSAAFEDGVVTRVCAVLDGLPLAVELAAAATRVLPPAALLRRVEESGLDPGVRSPRDLPVRQQTMTAALDWSHDLLDEVEADLFARLSVFNDGFDLDAAEAVASGGHVLAALTGLVDQSLVMVLPGPGPEPRFRLLEPVRQYAGRRLQATGQAPESAARHADYFHRRALEARPRLCGSAQTVELDLLEADHANLRSALLRHLELGRATEAAELASSLWLYLALRGRVLEGLSWLDQIGDAVTDRAAALAQVARLGLCLVRGDLDVLPRTAEELTTVRRAGDPVLTAEALTLAGHGAMFTGRLDQARVWLEEAHSLPVVGDYPADWARAHAEVALCQLELACGDPVAAERHMTAGLSAARVLASPFTLATALNVASYLAEPGAEDQAAVDLLTESAAISLDARLSWTLGYTLLGLAGLAVRRGDPETGTMLMGASAQLSADTAVDPTSPTTRELADRGLSGARDALSAEEFRAAWDRGRLATPEELRGLVDAVNRRVPD